MEVVIETLQTFFGTAKYPTFMVTNFSSKLMFVFFTMHFFYESQVFEVFDKHLASSNVLGVGIFRVLRAIITIFLGLVWVLKTEDGVSPPTSGLKGRLAPYTLQFQAGSVWLMTAALSIQSLYDVFVLNPQRVGLSPNGLLTISGLKQVAPMAFFAMRDTPISTIVPSWTICLAVSLICCLQAQDREHLVDLLPYAAVSFVIFSDTIQQNKKMCEIVTKLQNTLKENEQLAVEAQAIELRAMIGNVAHDLKTVIQYIFHISIVFTTAHPPLYLFFAASHFIP